MALFQKVPNGFKLNQNIYIEKVYQIRKFKNLN